MKRKLLSKMSFLDKFHHPFHFLNTIWIRIWSKWPLPQTHLFSYNSPTAEYASSILKFNINSYPLFFDWDSLHARLKATAKYGVTRKRNTKRLQVYGLKREVSFLKILCHICESNMSILPLKLTGQALEISCFFKI